MIRFLLRSAEFSDVSALYHLASQAALLNLPPDRRILEEKVDRSIRSFSDLSSVEDAEYLFVLEDRETNGIAGASMIRPYYVSFTRPHYYFRVVQKNSYQILKLGCTTEAMSGIGGLILDVNYRGGVQKLGKQISLIRLLYAAMFPDKFTSFILSELMAPVDDNGVNHFWEKLGRRFTGMKYDKALAFARQKNRSFIHDYFPDELILSAAEQPIHRSREAVMISGKGEQHILEKTGFRYLHTVDPMDGGLHYGTPLQEMTLFAEGNSYPVKEAKLSTGEMKLSLIGMIRDGRFQGGCVPVRIDGGMARLPLPVIRFFGIRRLDRIFIAPFR